MVHLLPLAGRQTKFKVSILGLFCHHVWKLVIVPTRVGVMVSGGVIVLMVRILADLRKVILKDTMVMGMAMGP
jgi:hypothetical protein